MAQSQFTPFPKASSPYWQQQVPAEMRKDYIQLGNQYLHQPWNAIPNTIFAEFRTNGNRTNYEALSFEIRKQMVCLVMAEIMEHQQRFLPAICQGLHYFIEKEPWWGIPAHYPKDHPEKSIQPVDLFNAETASMLAWTLYMLGDDIQRQEAGLCDSIRQEIQVRFLNPTLYEPQGWKRNANNWNTWITSNWLETMLICEKDENKRQEALNGIKEDLMVFLNGYPDDGACEEGVAYWDRAAASFFESLYFMQFLPQSKLELTTAQLEKVHRMGQFITTMHIHDLNFVNYSDASAVCVPNINILFPYGAYEKDEKMMQLAAYTGEKFNYLHKPSTLFLQSGNYPTLGRELMLLSMLPEYKKTPATQPRTEEAFMTNSQIMVASNKDWFVSMKGGTNAESHNHNDIGNFVIYHQNQPVIIDLGRDTYTSKSFSKERFELMNCRSAYHNVPFINGYEQKDGKQYRAMNADYISGDAGKGMLAILKLDLDKAYPTETQVNKWERTLTFNGIKNLVEIKEAFDFNKPQKPTEIILMCYGEPQQGGKGCILLQDGKVKLTYSTRQLTVSWEKVKMEDGIMKTQWHDNVYRIKLNVHKKSKDTIVYCFETKE